MALRIHRMSDARWAQLAESRHPIDLTDDATDPAPSDHRHDELERIQSSVDALTSRRARITR